MQLNCTKRSVRGLSAAAWAMRVAASMCTSSKLKFQVSLSRPVRLMITFERLMASFMCESSRMLKSFHWYICKQADITFECPTVPAGSLTAGLAMQKREDWSLGNAISGRWGAVAPVQGLPSAEDTGRPIRHGGRAQPPGSPASPGHLQCSGPGTQNTQTLSLSPR